MGGCDTAAPTAETWAARLTARWQDTVAGILDVSRMLVDAKAEVGHGGWLKLVARLPFGERTARRLIAIGEDERLAARSVRPA